MASEYKRLRGLADSLASEHAEKFFALGHAGVSHCDCKMAREVHRLRDEAAELRQKLRNRILCPTCGGTGKVDPSNL